MKKIILIIITSLLLTISMTGCSIEKNKDDCCQCKDCPQCDVCCSCKYPYLNK